MSSQYWTTIIERQERTVKTADFAGSDGSGRLLSPFWVGWANYAIETNETQATLAAKIKAEFETQITTKLKAEIESHNNTVIGIENIVVSVTWDKRADGTYWQIPLVALPLASCGCTVSWGCKVYTSQPIAESPFPAWGLLLLEMILKWTVIALVAYWTIQAAKDLIESWTTTKSKITTVKPDGTVITEETTTPNLGGMSLFFIAGIVAVVLVLFLFMGRG